MFKHGNVSLVRIVSFTSRSIQPGRACDCCRFAAPVPCRLITLPRIVWDGIQFATIERYIVISTKITGFWCQNLIEWSKNCQLREQEDIHSNWVTPHAHFPPPTAVLFVHLLSFASAATLPSSCCSTHVSCPDSAAQCNILYQFWHQPWLPAASVP